MISIIIPVYNAEKTIRKAVDSVLSQSVKDFELLLIDDGSTDQSSAIIDSYQDERIRVIHEENSGASHARNRGILEAKGDHICFIDSDDEYLPGFLEHMQNKTSDLVICKIKYQGEKSASGYPASFHMTSNEYASHMEDMIRKGILNSLVTKIYRTDIIRRNNLMFDEDMKVGEDMNFNFRYLMYTSEFDYLAEELYLYKMDESTGVHRKYIPNVIQQRRINIDLLNDYFLKNQIESQLINQLKIKLIYICVMQEIEAGRDEKDIWKMIDIPYFHEIKKTKGLPYQIMLRTYQSSNIKRICRLGRFLRKYRKYASSASV